MEQTTISNEYENGTKSLREKRRELHDKEELSEKQRKAALPQELDEKAIMKLGEPDKWKSKFALMISLLLAIPLLFPAFDYPEIARWLVSGFAVVVLFIYLCYVVKHASSEPQSLIPSINQLYITMFLGLVGIAMVVWSFWINLSEVQSATWLILNSKLSGALATFAAAPLLFVGARWWQLQIAKSTYLHTYTEADSESIREERRNEKRIKDDWTTAKSQHSS